MKNASLSVLPKARSLLVVCCLAAIFPVAAHAGETAFSAMRALRDARGPEMLRQLIEVRGSAGAPDPESWTFVFNDPFARGGIREIVVQNGMVLSERTPIGGFSGVGEMPVLPRDRLSLDSDGAFRIANQQAIKMNIGFHWLDYTLRYDSAMGAGPLWILGFVDYLGNPVGSMVVSAESLRIVRELHLTPASEAATSQSPSPAPDADANSGTPTPRGGLIGTVERFGAKITRDVSRKSLDVVGSVQELLIGERTIGIQEPTPTPAPNQTPMP